MFKDSHDIMFREYLKLSKEVGDPDSHVRLAGILAQDIEDLNERVWFLCLFASFYNVPTGYLVYQYWPLEKVLKDWLGFSKWIQENWAGFIVTTERRTVRTPRKMLESLFFCFVYAQEFKQYERSYDSIWVEINEKIRHFGRYICIKFLEAMYLAGVIEARIPDIRPVDGWSPRKTIAWLYPQHAHFSLKGNEPLQIQGINELTKIILEDMQKTIPTATMFDLEVVFCTYRTLHESVNGNYPGHTHDATLKQYHLVENYWGDGYIKHILEVRKEMFPEFVLGEIQGWKEPRRELNRCHKMYNYIWADTAYNYQETRDLEHPVRRTNESRIVNT